MIDEKNVLQQIKQIKRSLKSENHDYLTGYICALSAVEGMIAGEPQVGEWIPCSERLPEEKINPVTHDFYEYPVTAVFGDVKDIRHYKFGDGHWWHGAGIMDERVIAWMPLPEPYKEEKR